MSIEINAVDLEWKGRYGGGGGDAGGGGTGLSESQVRSMINSAISGVKSVTMEQVQEAIKAAGGTATVDPAKIKELVDNAVAGIDSGVSAEEVQQMIQAAGTGGSVDVPWKEIQIGYVSRNDIISYNGSAPANSSNFNVPYPKAFSQPPIVIARGDMNGLRFDVQMMGGTENHFVMQTNYGADMMGAHFIAFVPKG